MTLGELSKLYNLSCLNAHHLLDELYESCHTDEGDPKVSAEEIKAIKQSFLTKIRQELDLIQTAADEASEV
jgi:hypothetical protein